MDVSSMMNALQQQDAARRVAGGIGRSRGNGMMTSATTTTGAGKVAASALRGVAAPKSAAATSATAGTGAASSASGSAATSQEITSSDFLTLLVAEMQNQDPTQPTDPNTYIQQLVGVNSLQQLIAINSELAQATGGTSSGGTTPTPPVSGGVPSGG